MADTKPRTHPSIACQIYGEVPEKIYNTLFRKITGRRKQDNGRFDKIWGENYTVRGTCACITLWKNAEIQISCSIMHRTLLPCKFPPCFVQYFFFLFLETSTFSK